MDKTMLHDIFVAAVDNNASDILIRENKNVALRISGSLVEIDFVTSKEFLEKALPEIVPPHKMPVYEETGDLDFAWEEKGIARFRVNLHRQRGQFGLTFRYIKDTPPTVKNANLPEAVAKIAEANNGIIFISGTTGSGKSTTMAAMLDHINSTMNKHVITIEDPIEYTYTDKKCLFEQREVGLDAESFDSALVHALRQDPDIIVIGELRNRKTFEIAMAAAETGHLVITTMHTKDAAQSILRILDMFSLEEREPIRKTLSDILHAIVCQRLAQKVNGKGLIPINEILITTPIVKQLIAENQIEKISQAIEGGEQDGMISFNKSLLSRVNDGLISEETAIRLSDNPQALKMNLKGIFLGSGKGIIQ